MLCRWEIYNANYWILVVEPNNADYQTLDVATDVNFGMQTVTKKTIELAPWTTIA